MFGCRHAPLALSPAIEQTLAAAYAEPHRAYHTAAHIAEVLRWYDWVADEVGWREPAAVYLAIAFHDAVYDPLAKDNEARSAALARQLLGAAPAPHAASPGSGAVSPVPTAATLDRCAELILLTARHGALDPAAVAADPDAAHFLDCDTAILGAPPAEFDAYDAGVAAEYRQVPADAFRAGRRAFLSGMLARPRIFLSDLFHARLDAAARANLARAVARY
jgi:predicted metal-dependent HD superfamily phosphohydrolase